MRIKPRWRLSGSMYSIRICCARQCPRGKLRHYHYSLRERADAITRVLGADSRVKITYVKEGGPDTSQSVAEAENALTADPEIKLFMGSTEDIGLGADSVLTGRSGIDLVDYGIFAAGLSEGSKQLIELSKTNESAFRAPSRTRLKA